MVKKLERMTLKKQAEKALREMISSYRFTPGKWINVESLAKELHVSRTPVWQALKDLESEGLVTHVQGKGIRMAEMTLEMADDLYTVRGVLEGLAAGLAAQKLTQRAVRQMEAILRKQVEIIESKDLIKYSGLDFDFHAVIYESCGNWLLKELLENTKKRSRPFVCDISPILQGLYEDHENVLAAFKDKNAEAAEAVMRKHNRRMQNHIRWTLAKGNPESGKNCFSEE